MIRSPHLAWRVLPLVGALLALGACSPPGATAATLYVTPDGAAGDCTAAAPCASLDQAYRTAAPGDVVEVAAGSYPAQRISADATKALGSAPVTFRASGAVVLADFDTYASDVRYVGFELPRPYGTAMVRGGSNVAIEDFRAAKPYILGPSASSGADPIDGVTIRGGEFGPHRSCGAGFQINPNGGPAIRNVVVEGATFHDFELEPSCPGAHLDCLHSFRPLDGLTIRGSRFYRCEHFGALVNGASNVVVENNFFEGGIYGFKLRGDSDPSVETFDGVTIRHNSADEISLGSPGSNTLVGVEVVGNAVVRQLDCRSTATYRDNLAQSGSPCSGDLPPVAAIGFRDPAAGDFQLDGSSPAVDRLAGGPPRDIDGDARPYGAGYDVGADEVVQGEPPADEPTAPPEDGAPSEPPPDGDSEPAEMVPARPADPLPVGDGSYAPVPAGSTLPRRGRVRPVLRRVATRLRVSRRGVVSLRIGCVAARRGAGRRRCRGTVSLRGRAGARTLARGRVSIRRGHVRRVRMRLRPRVRGAVRRRGTVRARLRVVVRNPRTAPGVATRRVRLVRRGGRP